MKSLLLLSLLFSNVAGATAWSCSAILYRKPQPMRTEAFNKKIRWAKAGEPIDFAVLVKAEDVARLEDLGLMLYRERIEVKGSLTYVPVTCDGNEPMIRVRDSKFVLWAGHEIPEQTTINRFSRWYGTAR